MQILITTSDLGRCGSSEQSVPSSVSIFKDESSPTLPRHPSPGQDNTGTRNGHASSERKILAVKSGSEMKLTAL